MFSDIRGFTRISEHMSPQQTFNFLNDYLKQISPVIHQHNGFIDNYIGDGLMALFPQRAEDAFNATLAMNKQIAIYNQTRQADGHPPVHFGTGLHTGHLMLGIIGGGQRLQGTVIADAVNLASRVEALTKQFGVSVIITQQTMAQLAQSSAYHHRFLGRIQVKGRREPVAIYELFDNDPVAIITQKEKTKRQLETAVTLFCDQAYAAANTLLTTLFQQTPDDPIVQFYKRRIKKKAL